MHLPGKVTYKVKVIENKGKSFLQEIDEMIHTVDKNEDGKISYSEFRVSKTNVFSRQGKAWGCFTTQLSLIK